MGLFRGVNKIFNSNFVLSFKALAGVNYSREDKDIII